MRNFSGYTQADWATDSEYYEEREYGGKPYTPISADGKVVEYEIHHQTKKALLVSGKVLFDWYGGYYFGYFKNKWLPLDHIQIHSTEIIIRKWLMNTIKSRLEISGITRI